MFAVGVWAGVGRYMPTGMVLLEIISMPCLRTCTRCHECAKSDLKKLHLCCFTVFSDSNLDVTARDVLTCSAVLGSVEIARNAALTLSPPAHICCTPIPPHQVR